MEHYELVQEMPSVERMSTQDRLKHARKRRSQQLKKWTQYERQLEKESTKKKKHQNQQIKQQKKPNRNVRFVGNIALLEATARNDINEVKKLLESGVNPNVTNEDGLTALHQCCIDNTEEMMKLLLEYKANVNACDSEMWTPLHAAATCGHVVLCRHLIEHGAELLAVNADGNMPYDICEDEVTLDYIETEMAKRGITQEQIDETRLVTERKMLADLKELVAQGGNLDLVDGSGATMLHIAAANGYVEVAEFLLDNHVAVDIEDNESWQPIHAASYWAQQEILEMLVENGADLDAKTKNGETPFDLCEEPDLKQKILDMKDEIETNRAKRQQRMGSSRKHRVSSRNLALSADSLYSSNSSLNKKAAFSASVRRSSMRGDKSQLFKKEHKEEALHFGLVLMQDEDLSPEADDHENLPVTDLDEVTVVVKNKDEKRQQSSSASDKQPAPHSVTNITVGKPQPKPRSGVTLNQSSDSLSKATGSQAKATMEGQRISPNSSPALSDRNRRKMNADADSCTESHHELAGNLSGPKESQNQSISPPLPLQTGNTARHPSSNTLLDLKKNRSNSRENLLDTQVQNMFLESVQAPRRSNNTSAVGKAMPGEDKTKNGHNNNNAPSQGYTYSTADGQLRRYVAPNNAPVVGEEEKQKCCVIL
ncbi:protein phosphatase 1 regulatory subunit 16A-like isoform X2 [Pomacea canaliculata]|uniref:protein phosphatase 1 regulatory subunit 16A-like isoform X2 n=1 Tax=Pomacea canaliculata TaxID=400727 RepID=UPI000D72E88D|nr:protein phosphatase 1 regulatory subunit 16A-like isoform X2 [Pomacea canaliculata]